MQQRCIFVTTILYMNLELRIYESTAFVCVRKSVDIVPKYDLWMREEEEWMLNENIW